MSQRLMVITVVACMCLFSNAGAQARDSRFFAYYTRLDTGDPTFGRYADIVVNVDSSRQLIFDHQLNYLPYWQTATGKWSVTEIVRRQEDKGCRYSYVRIIENKPGKIVVHWRYIPNHDRPGFTGVVHEYFAVTSDAKVTRTIKVGTAKLDDWNDPANVTVQKLKLNAEGISVTASTLPKLPERRHKPIKGFRVQKRAIASPVAWWRFDEGLKPGGDATIESMSGKKCAIDGHKSLWKKGVSATALAFDGYFSKVSLAESETPSIRGALTVEAWVALGAYPFNTAPIIHHSIGTGAQGYYLGIDAYGYPVFIVTEKSVKSTVKLQPYRWTHVAGTYGNGEMRIYVDGKLAKSECASGRIASADTDLIIGLNSEKVRPTDPVRGPRNNIPWIFGLDGLIDEVKLYDIALDLKQVQKSYDLLKPSDAFRNNPDLEKRILPGEVDGKPAGRFGAYYTKLRYHDLWDNMWRTGDYPDLVVRFDQLPTSVVYWRGANYGPGWVTENNKWMADQSSETWGPHGCSEHMADKQCRFCHVRLIENTDARVVVHWRYPSVDVAYFFPSERHWSDEYHTIYPDGVGVRKVHFRGRGNPGWQDVQFFSQPGTTCLDSVNLQALTLANLRGERRKLLWSGANGVPENTLKDACIERINFKSTYKVFVMFQEGTYINPWGHREQSRYTDDPFAGPWNHWPVSQLPSDGRFAVANDRLTHAAIAAADNVTEHGNMALYGFTKDPIDKLVPLARSWNNPAPLNNAAGCASQGYDKDQRAYVLTAESSTLSFRLNGSDSSPVINPCFVIKNWKSGAPAGLSIDGKTLRPGPDFRQGIVRDTDGTRTMVIWIKTEATSPIDLELIKKQ